MFGVMFHFILRLPERLPVLFLVWGWGNLLLVASVRGRLRSFLLNPGFMIGDLVLLPLAGYGIARYFFYAQPEPVKRVVCSWWWKALALTMAVAYVLWTNSPWYIAPPGPFEPLMLLHDLFIVFYLHLFLSMVMAQIVQASTDLIVKAARPWFALAWLATVGHVVLAVVTQKGAP